MIQIYCDNTLIWDAGTNDKEYSLISPELIMENGKVAVLKFTIHPQNAGYSDIHLITSRIKVVEDGNVIFYGRPVAAERAFSRLKKVTCESALGFLRDIAYLGMIGEEQYGGANAIQTAFTHILNGDGASDGYNGRCDSGNEVYPGNIVGTNTVGRGSNSFKLTQDGRGTLGLFQNLIEIRPGQLAPRWVVENGAIKTYLDYTKDENITISSQEIRFAKNLLDLDEQIDGTGIFTVLRLYDSDNGVTYTYQDDNHVAQYGTIQAIINVSGINDRWSTASDGRATEAYRYYQENAYGISTVDLNAVDLHTIGVNVDAITPGGKYRVISEPHNYNGIVQCKKVTRRLDQPGRNKYEFGIAKETLTSTLVKTGTSSARRG